MITFLPYPDFDETAKVLDRQRLGKQRIEAYQILQYLTGEVPNAPEHQHRVNKATHPAFKMWRGYEYCLKEYTVKICMDWIDRGYQDSILERVLDMEIQEPLPENYTPPWLGDHRLHRSHRANLIRKYPEWYVFRFGETLPEEPYFWPVK